MHLPLSATTWMASIVLTVALGLMAGAAIPGSQESPDPRDKLNMWEGHWKMRSQRKDTPYTHAVTLEFDVVCKWASSRGYMVCDYLSDGMDPEEGKPSNHLSIFAYNDAEKSYKQLGISKDYKTLEKEAKIEGDVWTMFVERTTKKGDKIQTRDTYEFVSPDKQISRFEISADGGQHWTLMSEGVATKVN
jgi:hypothetical protein